MGGGGGGGEGERERGREGERERGREGERERGREGERERGRGRGRAGAGREKGQDKTDSFHWHREPDVVQAYSYRVTLLYGNADERVRIEATR